MSFLSWKLAFYLFGIVNYQLKNVIKARNDKDNIIVKLTDYKIQKYLHKSQNTSAELEVLPEWAQKDLKGLKIL